MILRIENHTPEVYVNESRDFQVLCRIFDVMFNALQSNIDSMKYITDTSDCDNKLLSLLQSKLGFFSDLQISDETLRYILEAFPYLVKNKGNSTAIYQALYAWFKLNHYRGSAIVNISNLNIKWEETETPPLSDTSIVYEISSLTGADQPETVSVIDIQDIVKLNPAWILHNKYSNRYWVSKPLSDSYYIDIYIEGIYRDISILKEIFKYILPPGYEINFKFYLGADNSDRIQFKDKANIYIISDSVGAAVRCMRDTANEDKIISQLFNAIDTLEVFSPSDFIISADVPTERPAPKDRYKTVLVPQPASSDPIYNRYREFIYKDEEWKEIPLNILSYKLDEKGQQVIPNE